MRILFDHGASVNFCDEYDQTLLKVAYNLQDFGAMWLLLEQGTKGIYRTHHSGSYRNMRRPVDKPMLYTC